MIAVTLKLTKVCKNTVRYDVDESELAPAVRNIYVEKSDLKQLGGDKQWPDKITVTVSL